jgi:hypothetical protein
MTWTAITSPADLPDEYEVVLISDGERTGLAFVRLSGDPERMKRMDARPDGWTIIWPVEHDRRMGKIVKWQKTPLP